MLKQFKKSLEAVVRGEDASNMDSPIGTIGKGNMRLEQRIRREEKILTSGIDRHPDRTEIDFRLQIQGNRKLIPCSRTF